MMLRYLDLCRHLNGWILLLTVIGLAGQAPARAVEGEGLEAGMVNPGYHEKPAWFKSSFLDIREDIREAEADGKRVMLYFYQDGCPYCKRLLEDNLGQGAIADQTRRHFDVIAINIWGDREVTDLAGKATTEKAFSADLKVMFTPTILMFDEAGKVALRMNGYYPPDRFVTALDYVSGGHEAKMSFADFAAMSAVAEGSPTLHQSGDYLAPAAIGKRKSGRPLLVLFEQTRCQACDELHLDILQREASKVLLGMFDVVLLDRWSDEVITTPEGVKRPVRDWANALSVNYTPTLVFYSAEGKEVFRTEGYLKAFHIESALDYVASGSYREQPNFQRYISDRNEKLLEQGIVVDLME